MMFMFMKNTWVAFRIYGKRLGCIFLILNQLHLFTKSILQQPEGLSEAGTSAKAVYKATATATRTIAPYKLSSSAFTTTNAAQKIINLSPHRQRQQLLSLDGRCH